MSDNAMTRERIELLIGDARNPSLPMVTRRDVLALCDLALEALARRDERNEKSPLEVAIDDIWRDVILKHKPNYGDWEYGGQAYRHIVAEFEELRSRLAEAEKVLSKLPKYADTGVVFVPGRDTVWACIPIEGGVSECDSPSYDTNKGEWSCLVMGHQPKSCYITNGPFYSTQAAALVNKS